MCFPVTAVATCMGFHPSLSLKYSPLRSFLNTIALTRCTRSISSSLLTTKIYTQPHVRAADSKARIHSNMYSVWFNWCGALLRGLYQTGSGGYSFQMEHCWQPWNRIRSGPVDLGDPFPPFPQLKNGLRRKQQDTVLQ